MKRSKHAAGAKDMKANGAKQVAISEGSRFQDPAIRRDSRQGRHDTLRGATGRVRQ